VLDCRFDLARADAGRHAYLQAHIPRARYADLNRDLSGPVTDESGRHPLPEPERLAGWLRAQGVGASSRVVAYDEANAAFAARAWWLLRWLGHDDVAVLDGGFQAWRRCGGAVESGEPPANAVPPAPAFVASLRPEASIDTAALLGALRDGRLLIDARAPDRFAGDAEPIDPVAGHVPGAVNHPFLENLLADGRFQPRAVLAQRWRERLAGRDPREAILMCGSGVTACQNLLALEIAGYPGARLYAGSWSEWIRDPRRPVARGA
jgi:thiosulfate/3-mercaptopyruvate sulfurtransferase